MEAPIPAPTPAAAVEPAARRAADACLAEIQEHDDAVAIETLCKGV